MKFADNFYLYQNAQFHSFSKHGILTNLKIYIYLIPYCLRCPKIVHIEYPIAYEIEECCLFHFKTGVDVSINYFSRCVVPFYNFSNNTILNGNLPGIIILCWLKKRSLNMYNMAVHAITFTNILNAILSWH